MRKFPMVAGAIAVSLGLQAGSAAAQRLPDGSVFAAKAVQRQIGVRTVVAVPAEHPATVSLNGKVVADPGAGGQVQASQPGRIEAPAAGMPTLGSKVAKGQILAWLRPTPGSIELGNQRAQLAELDAQLAIAERRFARLQQLDGAVPRKDVDAAGIERDALARRRAAVGAGLSAREPLRSPVAGVISVAAIVPGQVVDAKELLFGVIDPQRIAVEALAYDASLLDGFSSASGRVPGGALDLRFVGGGRQLREQAVPLLFRVVPGATPVAVGQPVEVVAKTARRTKGVAVSRAALVRGATGESAVWIHVEPERFVRRDVRVQPLDAETVLLASGVEEGERIVVAGAALLGQVR